MLVKTHAAALQGIDAIEVTIEANVTPGVRFMLVGLPDNAVKESHERIFSALQHNALPLPRKQVVVNMAPADIRKEGAAYDLPIAVAILAAGENIPPSRLDHYMMMGEMSLDGSLKPIKGTLPIAILAQEKGYKGIILPKTNAQEAAVVAHLDVLGADNITEVIDFLSGKITIEPTKVDTRGEFFAHNEHFDVDFDEVKGQDSVKRALEVAAAGGHNIIMIGPPGSGKSMMSRRFATILPPLTLREALETTKIHSVAGKLDTDTGLITRRPFRHPHHTISDIALVGGGTNAQPGEISLAHNGVLFLDELPEFKRSVLEVLRQPLEDRRITISRTKLTVEYPAAFTLVASMNPCPCGYYNDPNHTCTCPPGAVQRYLSRISGPLLDRIDMHIEITPVPFTHLNDPRPSENSATIRARVIHARQIQTQRFADTPGIHCNAQMTPRQIRLHCTPDPTAAALLSRAMTRYGLSARAHDRILKLARTIADLDHSPTITTHHISEAINYRNLDKDIWNK